MRQHVMSQHELLRRLRRDGWRIERHRGHYKARSPDGTNYAVIATSDSDIRGIKNLMKHITKGGE